MQRKLFAVIHSRRLPEQVVVAQTGAPFDAEDLDGAIREVLLTYGCELGQGVFELPDDWMVVPLSPETERQYLGLAHA